jgi:SAM-dependent methyltransferase
MKNAETWRASKYVHTSRGFRGSRDAMEVAVSSRLIADLTARFYEQVLPLYAKGRLLDIGCGKAPLYELYRPLVSEVVCVDWCNSPHENRYVDVFQDLNDPLEVSSESFETVILSDVLEHIRNPAALLCEIRRVMTPDAVLILNVPFLYSLHEEPYDFYRYTRYGLEYLTEVAGLRIVALEPLGGIPEVLGDIAAKVLAHIPRAGPTASTIVQRFVAIFLNTTRGKKISTKTAANFPLAYTLVAIRKH